MSVRQWLAENDIKEKAYYYWLRKFRKEAYGLAALYSFSEFAQSRDFEAVSVFRSAIIRIPSKKTPKKSRVGFSVEDLKIFLALPGTGSEIALRDTVLLSLMYATGARAQEICDLTVCRIQFRDSNTTVDIIGKGAKARRVRIPAHCAEMLKKYQFLSMHNSRVQFPAMIKNLKACPDSSSDMLCPLPQCPLLYT